MKAIITIGISASGKSTWARNYIGTKSIAGEIWSRIERDVIRRKILTDKTDGAVTELVWSKWNWKWESEVNKHVDAAIYKAIAHNDNIIISDTNLNKARRDQLIAKLEGLGFEVETKVFSIDFKTACERDAARANGVGHSVIARQYEQYCAEFVNQYEPDASLPLAVIVDIDGTIAHMVDRGPFEWDKVDTDVVDQEVRDVVNALGGAYHVLFVSGRDGSCHFKTLKWLKDNSIQHDALFMRKAGDNRSDVIVKQEIFDEFIRNQYNVRMVIDDRPKVCHEVWRAMGIKVLQVGNPYIEF